MPFKCLNDHYFEQKTHDGLCPTCTDDMEPLLLITDEEMAAARGRPPAAPKPPISLPAEPPRQASAPAVIEGLCLLVCDASGSMEEAAFSDTPLSKLNLVASAAAKAIYGLNTMSKRDVAYVGIIAFGERAALIRDRQNRPFLMPIAEINREYGEEGLGRYIAEYLSADKADIDRSNTNITAALKLAREIYDAALQKNVSGALDRWGIPYVTALMDQSDIVRKDKTTGAERGISVPNMRVLIYSDGMHNPRDGALLVNAFASLQPSVLLTAFIGEESKNELALKGADEMRSLATICPEHEIPGYFLINRLQRYTQLRNLFRMASGASGFCSQCLRRETMHDEMRR